MPCSGWSSSAPKGGWIVQVAPETSEAGTKPQKNSRRENAFALAGPQGWGQEQEAGSLWALWRHVRLFPCLGDHMTRIS